ncbi:MAG: PepSY-like domain-containing protein [Ginsengibacter sp.]
MTILLSLSTVTFAQRKTEDKKEMESQLHVPTTVRTALTKKYPEASKVTWEKEKGNYEANWGGRDGEANSVQFTPSGEFIEIVQNISAKSLPAGVLSYMKEHYKGAKLGDTGKVTDANGITFYEVEIKGRDVIFDESGNFVKEEK